MNIAIILDSLCIGGAELLAIRLGSGFVEAGHSVTMIAVGGKGSLEPILDKMCFTHTSLNCPAGISCSAMLSLYHYLKNQQIDLILSNHLRQLVHTWLPAVLLGIPHYQIEHDNNHYKAKKRYLWLLSCLCTRLRKFIVVSPTLERWFRQNLPFQRRKITLITNGVDTSRFLPSPESKMAFLKEHSFSDDHIIFGTCARLEPIKNLNLMIRIFQRYHTDNPNSCLLLVGDGSCSQQLKIEARQLGIENDVFFLGFHSDVIPWLQVMDIYLITSDDEGLPLSVLEAMACGVPVVARSVGDLPRLINEHHGRLVNSEDMKDWVQAIEQITNDRGLRSRLATNARQLIINEYSLKNCQSSYLKLFQ